MNLSISMCNFTPFFSYYSDFSFQESNLSPSLIGFLSNINIFLGFSSIEIENSKQQPNPPFPNPYSAEIRGKEWVSVLLIRHQDSSRKSIFEIFFFCFLSVVNRGICFLIFFLLPIFTTYSYSYNAICFGIILTCIFFL